MNTFTVPERERLAYIEGFTEAAGLLARLDDMHHALEQATIDYENLKDDHAYVVRQLIDLEAS